MVFGHRLKEIRMALGYKTATAFYDAFKAGILPSFNYSYYSRVESGKALPSSQFVNELVSFYPPQHAEQLIRLWCQSVFPNHGHMFSPEVIPDEPMQRTTTSSQKYLTLKQVDGVTKSFEHYQVFVLATLARKAFELNQLTRVFDFDVEEIISEFSKLQLLSVNEGLVRSYNPNLRFPKADTDKLRARFKLVESWNRQLGSGMSFENIKQKFFINRTSKLHMEVLLGMTEQIDRLIRMTEELDDKKNNDIVMIEYKLWTGRLPG